jgi:hypothetical protein
MTGHSEIDSMKLDMSAPDISSEPAESIGAHRRLFKSFFYAGTATGRATRAAIICAMVAVSAGRGVRAQEPGIGKSPGSQLLELCQAAASRSGEDSAFDRDATANDRVCIAFIDGFIWGHAWASWREAKDMWFCLPVGFSARQGAKDVVRYLSAHPDRLDEDGHLLVFLALTSAYPCKPY